MVIKEFIGIYLEKDVLHYCGAVRRVSSWQLAIPGASMDPSGILPGPAPTTLREFLQRLSPKPGRRIFLALPRGRFFIRDIQLPPVPMEDALMSVESLLPVTCHLPPGDIFHNVYLCRMPDGRVSALVIYALRREILPVLEIFRETGHEKSLVGLFPISLGIGAWLSLQQYAMPMGLMISQESSAGELAVYQPAGCVYSIAWQKASHADEASIEMESAAAKFHLPAGRLYRLETSGGCPILPDPAPNRLPWLPSIRENLGVAALSAALSNQQQILLNGGAPRVKLFRLWRLFVPVVLVLSAILSIWAMTMNQSIE